MHRTVTAQAIAGVANNPFRNWSDVQAKVTTALFTRFPTAPVTTTALGNRYKSVLKNLLRGLIAQAGLRCPAQ